MSQPDRVVIVCGTGTEVGKTYVACGVARALQSAGFSVAARKPTQSYPRGDDPTDAELLGAATGEAPAVVCPADRSYPLPLAPPMAAEALGRPPCTIADLAGGLRWTPGVDVGLVETVGGVRSPLAADGDTVDLARVVRPDLVTLVAEAGLGAINAVRLSADALTPWPLVVHLNRFDGRADVHTRNREWLAGRDGLTVTVSVGSLARVVAPTATGGDRR
jgi:dethiobiotin synthetase